MDNEALKTAKAYKQMEEQHFNGGYFSDAVKADTEKALQLNEEEKRAFFTDTFNKTCELAREIQQNPAFQVKTIREDGTTQGTLDLGDDIGVIHVDVDVHPAEERDENVTVTGVVAYSESFDPTPGRDDEVPRFWDEPVWVEEDGSLAHENIESLDESIPRLLDMRETLEVAREQLATKN